ncbi:MAG: hypothetical protein GX221_00115 [Candidatus Riflebacteria bacterium]|nr:hypothetical protein [Candidatus Riflebacteria bacterium]
MGVVIPLFKTKVRECGFELTSEEKLRISLIQSAMETLHREEENIEQEIARKCREEIARMNMIDRKLQELEFELEAIYQNSQRHNDRIS